MDAHEQELERRTEELVARAIEGDREAISALYQIYEAGMIATAHQGRGRTLHRLMESVDLVQSTWTDILDDLVRFRPRGPGSFEAWLQTCLRNKIRSKGRYHGAARRDAHQLRSLEGDTPEEEVPPPLPASDPTPSRIVIGREEVDRLMHVLRDFPEEQRTVLILRMRDGETYASIAERIGRSIEATKKLHGRGLRKLAEALERG